MFYFSSIPTDPERFIHLTSMIPSFKILEGPFGGSLNIRQALDKFKFDLLFVA